MTTPSSNPLVSICIPTYNGSKFIKETLDSAISQTYNNLEIVITDDCSTDNTIEICYEYAKKDSRIKVYKNKKNIGLVGNWKECLAKSNSNWIKFLFQDDLISPNCVEVMIDTAIKNKVNFVICDRTYIFEEGVDDHAIKFYKNLPKTGKLFNEERPYTPKETSKIIANHVFRNCIGEPPTLLLNKNFYSEKDFPDNYFQLIDYIFVLNKILKYDFVFVNEKFVKFRVHNNSESKRNNTVNPSNKESFYKFIYIKYYENILICNAVLNNTLFKEIKKNIPNKDIIMLKNWYIIDSYKKYGFKNVYPFYQTTKLNTFILDKFTSKYSLLKYRIFKVRSKKYRKKYGV